MRTLLLSLIGISLFTLLPNAILAGNGLSPTNDSPVPAAFQADETLLYVAANPLTDQADQLVNVALTAEMPATHPGGIITLILAIAGLFLFPVALNTYAPSLVGKLSGNP